MERRVRGWKDEAGGGGGRRVGYATHHFREEIGRCPPAAGPRKMRRLLREVGGLTRGDARGGSGPARPGDGALPLSPDGAVFLLFDQTRLDVCKVRPALGVCN